MNDRPRTFEMEQAGHETYLRTRLPEGAQWVDRGSTKISDHHMTRDTLGRSTGSSVKERTEEAGVHWNGGNDQKARISGLASRPLQSTTLGDFKSHARASSSKSGTFFCAVGGRTFHTSGAQEKLVAKVSSERKEQA